MQPFDVDCYGPLGAAADRYLRILASVRAFRAFSPSTDSQGYDLNFSQRMRRKNVVQTRLYTRLSYLIYLGSETMVSHGTMRLSNSAQSLLVEEADIHCSVRRF